MIRPFCQIIVREWYLIRNNSSQWAQPWVFLSLMAILPAIVIGELIKSSPIISAVFIVLALVFSSMLTIDKSIRQDFQDGLYTQWLFSGWSLPWLMFAKSIAHWLFWILPMVLVSPLLMVMFSIKLDLAISLFVSLLLATPLLSFVGLMSSSLTLSVNASGFLLALIMLPIVTPMMLLCLSPIQSLLLVQSPIASYALLAALTVLSGLMCPMACAFGIKVSHACGNI